jgi:hypothetical protein
MIRLNFPPSLVRATHAAGRLFHLIKRSLELTEAVISVAAGTIVALGCAALLRLSDVGLIQILRATSSLNPPPPVEGTRTVLLIIVFAGLIWAASACRRTREWFHPDSNGGAL